jgi:hypothetical protein
VAYLYKQLEHYWIQHYSDQLDYLKLMPYYLITKHLAEPSSLPLNAYVFNKIGVKDARICLK